MSLLKISPVLRSSRLVLYSLNRWRRMRVCRNSTILGWKRISSKSSIAFTAWIMTMMLTTHTNVRP